MRLLDMILREAIRTDLKATTRDDAIREIIDSLYTAGALTQAQVEEVVERVIYREQLGSTCVGDGIAVPHARCPSVEGVLATIAVSRGGIEFNALDGKPVHIVFFVIIRPEKPSDKLRVLEVPARFLKRTDLMQRLRQVDSPAEVVALIEEFDGIY
jgi:PTS system fructose-specific IIA component/PTS system nitrogen regulatory IIA component